MIRNEQCSALRMYCRLICHCGFYRSIKWPREAALSIGIMNRFCDDLGSLEGLQRCHIFSQSSKYPAGDEVCIAHCKRKGH